MIRFSFFVFDVVLLVAYVGMLLAGQALSSPVHFLAGFALASIVTRAERITRGVRP